MSETTSTQQPTLVTKEFITIPQIAAELRKKSALVDELNSFEKIVVVTRGGLAVAAILSQFIDSRWFDTLCMSSYKDKTQQKQLKIHKAQSSHEEVLLVEDIVDSGRSLLKAKEYYPNAKSFALHYKDNPEKITPDYYLWRTDKWIVYPWEVNEM
jgi:xanthine phosphoribosyltransferase